MCEGNEGKSVKETIARAHVWSDSDVRSPAGNQRD